MTLTAGGDLSVGDTDPTGGYAYNSATRIIGVSGDSSASTAAYGVLNLNNNRATPSATDALGLVGFTSSNSVAGQTLKAYMAAFNSGAGGVTGGFGGYLAFYTKPDNSTTGATEHMRIAATGEVLVGITTVVSGGANLQVLDGITFPATQVTSANANTLDDYREATWTATATGMTTSPTGTVSFVRIGNSVVMDMPTISGTSNSSAFTLTGMPTTCRPSATRSCIIRIQDNSAAYVAGIAEIASTGVITFRSNLGTGVFTTSGTKSVGTIQMTYII
jgi:hypothetical protein